MVDATGSGGIEGDIRKRSKSAVLACQHRPGGAADGRRPRFASDRGVLHRGRSPAHQGGKRATDSDRCGRSSRSLSRRFCWATMTPTGGSSLPRSTPALAPLPADTRPRMRFTSAGPRPGGEYRVGLIGVFACQSPGYHDDMLVLDSTPVETARSRETVKRAGDSVLADAIGDSRRLRLQPRALAVLLRHAIAPVVRAGRHPASRRPCGPPSAARREVAIGLLARGLARRRDRDRRQGLRRPRVQSRRGTARRDDHPTQPQDRARASPR